MLTNVCRYIPSSRSKHKTFQPRKFPHAPFPGHLNPLPLCRTVVVLIQDSLVLRIIGLHIKIIIQYILSYFSQHNAFQIHLDFCMHQQAILFY